MNQPPVEPSAAARGLAKVIRDHFLALVAEGFTEPQALVIVGQILGASIGGSK